MEKKYFKRRLSSLLNPKLKAFFFAVLVLASFMLANSLYLFIYRLLENLNLPLFTVAETSLSKLLQIMILSHTGVGIVLTVVVISFVIIHLPKVWRRRNKTSILSGIFYVITILVLLITGLFIFSEAASRNNQWAWWLHVICGLLVIIGHLTHRLVSYTRPLKINIIKYFALTLAVTVFIILAHSISKKDLILTTEARTAIEKQLNKTPGARDGKVYPLVNDNYAPQSFVSSSSPFFPSAVTTSSGSYLPARIITQNDSGSAFQLSKDLDKHGFAQETKIGSGTCERCHRDIAEQWAESAHRFASFNNPFYEASIMDMRRNHKSSNEWVEKHQKLFPESVQHPGIAKSKFCGACHDPSILLTGAMKREIDRRRPESQAGLTCLACHAIDKVHDRTGNGNYNIADLNEDPYLFAGANKGTIGAFLHDALIKARPDVHKKSMLKPFFRSSEYCATCHKVSLTYQLNNYRWLRGQNEYDNWHDSGVSLNAARTFYLPPAKRVCQDCHMPAENALLGDLAAKNGMVKSHRFLAVNTALPFLRGDTETINRIEQFLQNEKLRVDIFAIHNSNINETITAPDQNQVILQEGTRIIADVVVRNKGIGHTFPGGTNDSNEGWLEFSVLDESGNTLAISGYLDKENYLDPMAHVFKVLALDKTGNAIIKRNAQDIHSIVYANVIGPGTADIAHYEFTIPDELSGKRLTLKARLLWRKFNREYSIFAFNANPEGFKQFSDVPVLPVTEIASDEVSVYVSAAKKELAKNNPKGTPQWIRYNDYGIGLLLENDTRGAIQAFKKVHELEPNSIEGPLNLAKTYLKDGNINKVFSYLEKCEQIDQGNARVAWVWGLALQEDGQYDKAVSAYKRVLQEFPEDRATWRNIGRTYYLNQEYKPALEAFDQVLRIDPEDRIAHYHRMLCFKALGNEKEFDQARTAYEFYQIDESALKITRQYRQKNPGANLMSQAVRTHSLVLKQSLRNNK